MTEWDQTMGVSRSVPQLLSTLNICSASCANAYVIVHWPWIKWTSSLHTEWCFWPRVWASRSSYIRSISLSIEKQTGLSSDGSAWDCLVNVKFLLLGFLSHCHDNDWDPFEDYCRFLGEINLSSICILSTHMSALLQIGISSWSKLCINHFSDASKSSCNTEYLIVGCWQPIWRLCSVHLLAQKAFLTLPIAWRS